MLSETNAWYVNAQATYFRTYVHIVHCLKHLRAPFMLTRWREGLVQHPRNTLHQHLELRLLPLGALCLVIFLYKNIAHEQNGRTNLIG